SSQLAPEHNAGFLRQCVERFNEVNFADSTTGRIYTRTAKGAPIWADGDALRDTDSETRAALAAVVPALFHRRPPAPDRPTFIAAAERIHTLGTWGPRA